MIFRSYPSFFQEFLVVVLLLSLLSSPSSVSARPSSTTSALAHQWALSVGQRFASLTTTQLPLSRTTVSSSSSPTKTSLGGELVATPAAASKRRTQRPTLPSLTRGGAAAIKTMTRHQMEAFNLLSGGVAGTIASTLTNPLEVIKTQLQSSNKVVFDGSKTRFAAVAHTIMQADGLAGFFRGLPATLVGIIPSRSVYFYSYQRSKKFMGRIPGMEQGSPPNALVAGFLAGIAANTITNPIWMVRTRMQLLADSAAGQVAYRGYRDAVRTIFHEEGLKGFYKGVAASYWGCTEGALQFLIYEQLKARLLKQYNRQRQARGLPPTDHLTEVTLFLSAAASKMVASIATYPHEVARTRLREQAKMGIFKYKGMWQTLGVIAREEGRRGLYSGMGVHLLKVVPNSALMFLTYELVRKWLGEFQVVD